MVSPFSLSSSLQGKSSVCMCVCAHSVLVYCVGLIIFNFIMCTPLFIYNKDFISLNFCICICVLLSGAFIPCPTSLLQHTLSCCSSTRLKHTQQSGCMAQKRPAKSEEESGRVGERSHKLCRPWHHSCWRVLHFVRRTTTKISLSAVKVDSEHLRVPHTGVYEVPKSVCCARGATHRGFAAIT